MEKKPTKLRLLLTEECDRDCEGCCNKDFDLASLPVCTDFSPYDEVLITGGEPMLDIDLLHSAIRKIRKTSKAEIYVYTAKCWPSIDLLPVLAAVDGITVTIHDDYSATSFERFDAELVAWRRVNRSLRLNVFAGVRKIFMRHDWAVRRDCTWQKDCPLPDGEVFMRYAPSGEWRIEL